MARRRTVYELRIGGKLAARGDADMLAELLGLSPNTVQRMPYKKHGKRGVEVRPLPILYIYKGRRMTAGEIAEQEMVSLCQVHSAVYKHSQLMGCTVRKYGYKLFSVGKREVGRMLKNLTCDI